MDPKSFLAVIICLMIYLGSETYFNMKYPDRFEQSQEKTALNQTNKSEKPNITANNSLREDRETVKASLTQVAENDTNCSDPITCVQGSEPLGKGDLTIENDAVSYLFNQSTGGLDSVILKLYENEDHTGLVDLIENPLILQGAMTTDETQPILGFKAVRDGNTISFSRNLGSWQIGHYFQIPEQGYGFKLTVHWKNTSTALKNLTSALLIQEKIHFAKPSSSFLPGQPTGRTQIVYSTPSGTSWKDVQKYCEEDKKFISEENLDLVVAGVEQLYFLKALIPDSKNTTFAVPFSDLKGKSCKISQLLSLEQGMVAPGGTVKMSYRGWFGPKEIEAMEAYEPKLKESIDFGFFGIIAKPLLFALKMMNSQVNNWGLSIILFTLLLKILFYPLAKQASVAQTRFKALQPQINELKKKHQDDRAKLNIEMMEFMKKHKVNPAKGCLPMFPQIPVFIAFYKVLSISIELRDAPFIGWIKDLSVPDPYYISPILLGITFFAQQLLTPVAGLDKSQERIMMVLPIVFSVLMLSSPAGLVLYMFTNSITSIGQQHWLNKRVTQIGEGT